MQSIVDMHLALWGIHQAQAAAMKHSPLIKSFSQEEWWRDVGTYTCTLPRRGGKTTFVQSIAQRLLKQEQSIILVAPSYVQEPLINYQSPQLICYRTHMVNTNMFNGFDHSQYNLIIDEVSMLPKEQIVNLWTYNWKTVTFTDTFNPYQWSTEKPN